MTKYAVLGNPIAHSKSPLIHSLFAEQTKQEMSYVAVALQDIEFDSYVRNFFSEGGGGLNITVPFKGKAFEVAASCSPRAELAQAVNTLFLDEQGEICGDNTDGIGLMNDLKRNNGIELSGRRVLILGAGGAVRGILASLVFEQTASISVVNRTVAKAEQLAEAMKPMADIEVMSYKALQESAEAKAFDLIINGTSSSLQGGMPTLDAGLIAAECCCYDLMYAAQDTPFVRWAKEQGATLSIDGLGMLVEQAAEAFALWRGVRPDTAAVIAKLRADST